MKIYALGDSAITIEFSEKIDDTAHSHLLAVAAYLRENPFVGLLDLVPAYTTLSVYYDILTIRKHDKNITSAHQFVKNHLEQIIENQSFEYNFQSKTIEIPVCYDGEDLEWVCEFCQITKDELIDLHTTPLYKVYMIGFLPGFPYLGGLDKKLEVPRKANPRTRVKAGSVGLAGTQTGIYPQESPGGWQLIGSTNVILFDEKKYPPTLLQAGDFVKFLPR